MITLAASAGGIDALKTILRALPKDLPASVVVLQHRTPRAENHFIEILERAAAMPVLMAEHDQVIQPAWEWR
jgi:two-component system chemotaxis response regulator CheB